MQVTNDLIYSGIVHIYAIQEYKDQSYTSQRQVQTNIIDKNIDELLGHVFHGQ